MVFVVEGGVAESTLDARVWRRHLIAAARKHVHSRVQHASQIFLAQSRNMIDAVEPTKRVHVLVIYGHVVQKAVSEFVFGFLVNVDPPNSCHDLSIHCCGCGQRLPCAQRLHVALLTP